jgi:hypothetical protein
MTVVAIPADPPREGLVLSGLADSTPLTTDELADLYAAGLRDAVAAVVASGGDALVNYRPDDLLPEAHVAPDEPAESAVRSALADAVAPDEVRFEKQVGSTPSARVGNTITHLLREEGATSAAVLRPTAPLVARTQVDEAAMKLRRSAVVLGPTDSAGTYYAGFTEPVDFEDVLSGPELETFTDRGREEGLEVDYLSTIPSMTTPTGLLGTVVQVRARTRAERSIPVYTAETIADLGLAVGEEDGTPTLVRE